jgi:hypothetical protein
MFEAQRQHLKGWLSGELHDWYESDELSDEFADRILGYIWQVLEPALDDRLAAARDEAYDLAAECSREY